MIDTDGARIFFKYIFYKMYLLCASPILTSGSVYIRPCHRHVTTRDVGESCMRPTLAQQHFLDDKSNTE
jgi:hypothetical protein